jgi:hypothetical protein
MWKSLVLFSNTPVWKSVTSVGRVDVIQLYRNLLKGRRTFQYTDKKYYTKRVRDEFKQNAYMGDKEEVLKAYKVCQ